MGVALQHCIPHPQAQGEPQEAPQVHEKSEDLGHKLLEKPSWKVITSVLDVLCPVLQK